MSSDPIEALGWGDESGQDAIAGLYAVARAVTSQIVRDVTRGVPEAVESIDGAAAQARHALRHVPPWVAMATFLLGMATGAGLAAGLAVHYLLTPQLDALADGHDAIRQLLREQQDPHDPPAHGGRAER